MILQPGTLLDNKYRIEALIGLGGFGHVYRAHETLTGETVAVKELAPGPTDNPQMVQRFLQEARATLRLTHPHIARTYSVFQEEDSYYLVMEYLPGGSMAERLRRGPMTTQGVVQVALDLCAALECAHDQGVVHCDVKPANVLFDEGGQAHLADFGIAHVSQQLTRQGIVTGTGVAMGTLRHMAPEQLDGVRNDPRVDLYALGTILYEILAGRPYLDFETEATPAAQMRNIERIQREAPQPLRTVNPGVPEWLARVVERTLHKAPDERFATARALREALEQGQAGDTARSARREQDLGETDLAALPSISLSGAVPRSRSGWRLTGQLWAVVAGLVLLVIVGSVAIGLSLFNHLGESSGWPPTTPISLVNVGQVKELARWGKGTAEGLAYSPDGKSLAVASSLGVYLYNAGTLQEVMFIPTATWPVKVAFSPDGTMVATGSSEGLVQLWQVSDGTLVGTLGRFEAWVTGLAYYPDGTMVLAKGCLQKRDEWWCEREAVYVWQVSDGSLMHVLPCSRVDGAMALSPDGAVLALAGEEVVALWKVSSGSLLRTLEAGAWVDSVAFSPNGDVLATGSKGAVRMWRVSDNALLHTLEQDLTHIGVLIFSPDGSRLVTGSQYGDAYVWQVSNWLLLHTLEDKSGLSTAAFSPDGTTLATASWFFESLKLWDTSNGTLLRTADGYINGVASLAFSPDGSSLASGHFMSPVQMWQVSSKTLVYRTSRIESAGEMAFSPDGTLLAVANSFGEGYCQTELWRLTDETLLHSLDETLGCKGVAFSPDGTTLAAFAYSETGETVGLWQVSDGALLRAMGDNAGSMWSLALASNGQTLATGAEDYTVRLWRASDGTLIYTLSGHTDLVDSLAFSPDSLILASGSRDSTIRIWRVNDGALLHVLKGHTGYVNNLAFSLDGGILASAGGDGSVRLWRVGDGTLLRTLEGHKGGAEALAISPDGTILASGGGDATIWLWGVAP